MARTLIRTDKNGTSIVSVKIEKTAYSKFAIRTNPILAL